MKGDFPRVHRKGGVRALEADVLWVIVLWDCVINQVTLMGGRTINCSFLPPLYEGYWFRTQSLLLGNPTNPSMAVLGPLWLYEAAHWQIVPTKEYNSWMAMPSRFCTTIIWSRFAWECFKLSQSQFWEMSPTSPSLLTMSSSWRRELQGVHSRSGCGSIRG